MSDNDNTHNLLIHNGNTESESYYTGVPEGTPVSSDGNVNISTEEPAPKSPYHHTVEIEQVGQGFIVKVGCQTVVVESRKKLRRALNKFYSDEFNLADYYSAKENNTLNKYLFGKSKK